MYNHLTSLASVKVDTFAQACTDLANCDFEKTAQENNAEFWGTALGGVIKTMLGALGIILVIVALLKAVKSVSSGKVGEAVKVVFGAVVLAVFMFQPEMIATLIGAVGGGVGAVIETLGELVGGK